ncbi:unnamed protein product [Rhizoctonia solani]|uniref:Transmembrane protein n=1 Tax=Rhizoctonia solani TaxID=456999 RepID=A0A8H2XEV6_9AGAM|nr:unnamed protein product [Rhizoctonia solani]CAE6516978.1 unnamed protein product [Rhizoctonia solani]
MTRLNIPLFVALAASLLSAVPVDARDAHPHQRMIRKRGPPVVDGPGIGSAAVIGLRVRQIAIDPTGSASQSASSAAASTTAAATSSTREATTSAAPTTTSSVVTSSTAAPTTSTSSSTSVARTSTSSGGLLDSLTAILGSSTASSSSSSSSTSSSVSSTTPASSAASSSTPVSTSTTQVAAPTTTTTQQQQQQPAAETSPTLNIATPPPATTARGPSISVNVVTSTQAYAEASASVAAAKEKTRKITRNTIVSLVVVASCIGGAIAIWTVIRKWKLSPSEKFDDRMQPIDWAPPPANGATEEAIEEKSKHRRAGSGASHGSFTSGGVGQSDQGHGAKYADSQHGYGPQSQDFPPPHDFTAGTAQPGGYGQYYGAQPQHTGVPGYADLQRGPSLSESTYSHGANVSRGMSYSRGHGAYDSQSGTVPQMPNPYAGEYAYDDYNHPPAGQQPQAAQAQTQGQAPYRTF